MDAGVQTPASARGAQTLADRGPVDGRVSSYFARCSMSSDGALRLFLYNVLGFSLLGLGHKRGPNC